MNVLITGTSSGLGESLCEQYIESGHKVFSITRNKSSQKVKLNINCDLENNEDVRNILCYLDDVESFDYVYLNAGILGKLEQTSNITVDEMIKSLSVNAISNKIVIDYLISRKKAKNIISISSGASFKPYYGWASYCCSKAFMRQLIACYSLENNDINFLSLAPGIIKTKMQDYIFMQDSTKIPSVKKFQDMYEDMPTSTDVAKKIINNIDAILEMKPHDSYFDLRTL